MKSAQKFIAAAIALLAAPIAAYAQGNCEDDQRLFRIGSFIAEAQTGQVDPLAITPTTYLNLTPGARSAIGDNLVILDSNCQPVEVFNGEPPVRLEVPFSKLYNGFMDAIYRGDDVALEVMLNAFRAEPVESLTLITLLAPINATEEVESRIKAVTGIRGNTGSEARHRINEVCPNIGQPYISYGDLFTHFGGIVQGTHGTARFAISPYFIHDMDNGGDIATSAPRECVASPNEVQGIIARAGGDAFIYSLSSAVIQQGWSSRQLAPHREAHEKWIEAGAPENDLPTGLFN